MQDVKQVTPTVVVDSCGLRAIPFPTKMLHLKKGPRCEVMPKFWIGTLDNALMLHLGTSRRRFNKKGSLNEAYLRGIRAVDSGGSAVETSLKLRKNGKAESHLIIRHCRDGSV